jgi:hypothetical protein
MLFPLLSLLLTLPELPWPVQARPAQALAKVTVPGKPAQLEFHDLNGDGHLDLLALMHYQESTGEVDAFYEAGTIYAAYSESTRSEKRLVWIPLHTEGAGEVVTMELGTEPVSGFQVDKAGAIHLWSADRLRSLVAGPRFRQLGETTLPPSQLGPVGKLAWTWLLETPEGPLALLPDVNQLRLLPLPGSSSDRPISTLAMPMGMAQPTRQDGEFQLTWPLPQAVEIDGVPPAELTFDRGRSWQIIWLSGEKREELRQEPFLLRDLDGDHLADLLFVREGGEVERISDLPKIQSELRLHRANGPLSFSETPDFQGLLAGYLLAAEGDVDLPLNPFFDLNDDGRTDLLGVAFKFGKFQVVKALASGRATLTFLLHFHLQTTKGFHTLPGGPYELEWKFNIRRIKAPEFAQITADLDGDGWLDIFLPSDRALLVTPLTAAGLARNRQYRCKLPEGFTAGDTIFARNLDGDPTHELVFLKTTNGATTISWGEVRP